MRTLRRLLLVALCLVLLPAAGATGAAADPVAVLVGLSGRVEVVKGGRTAAVSVGLGLDPGDRVLVPAGGKAVLMYSTGRLQTATEPLLIEAPSGTDRGGLYARTLNTMKQVASTDANRQPNRQGMIRPVQGEAVPIAPRNGVRLLEVRPTFTWYSLPATTAYMIQLRRTDVPGSRPIRFEVGGDTVWRYPASAVALVPGASYAWTVGPATGGRVAQQQSFRVIDPAGYEQVSTALAELSAAGIDPTSDGLFLMALVYRDAGLLYEAESALARLAAQGAGSGRIYHLLRGEVLNGLGDLDGAAREFSAADAEASQ